MGKPCVINASVGTKHGSHDAKDPSALFIDNLITAKNGRLFVCSAGNDGGKNYHLKHTSNSSDTIFTFLKPNPNRSWGQMLSGWGYPSCAPACYGDSNVDFLGYADTANFNNVSMSISAYHNDNIVGSSPYINIPDYLNGAYPMDSYGNYYTTIKNSNNDTLGTILCMQQLYMIMSMNLGSLLILIQSPTIIGGFTQLAMEKQIYGQMKIIIPHLT